MSLITADQWPLKTTNIKYTNRRDCHLSDRNRNYNPEYHDRQANAIAGVPFDRSVQIWTHLYVNNLGISQEIYNSTRRLTNESISGIKKLTGCKSTENHYL